MPERKRRNSGGIFIERRDVFLIIALLLVVKIVVGLPQHTDLTFDNRDDTFCIDIYSIAIKGNFDESDTEYKLFLYGSEDTRSGLIMLKTDNEHIVDKSLRFIKFVREEDSISEYPHVAKPVKFVLNY